jgi:ribonuclease VapC
MSSQLLASATSSTLNLAEVQGKLVGRGLDPDDAWEAALSPIREATAFTEEHARIAGDLVTQTKALGLSLADRACLALAITLNAPVYTADRAWKHLKLSIRIHVLR